ncbi:MAG: 3-hydroxyacyl-ACP dehydratase FabZ family protein [Gemmatimonadaceae bacterium]
MPFGESPAAPLPQVMGMLAHRYPFLLVDRITRVEHGKRVEGVKLVTADEWLCRGRQEAGSPAVPLAMPNLLVIEAIAQLTGAILLGLVEGSAGAIGYFVGFEGVRFRGEAHPGEELRLEAELVSFRRGICRTRGAAWVGGKRIVRARLTTVIRTAAGR